MNPSSWFRVNILASFVSGLLVTLWVMPGTTEGKIFMFAVSALITAFFIGVISALLLTTRNALKSDRQKIFFFKSNRKK